MPGGALFDQMYRAFRLPGEQAPPVATALKMSHGPNDMVAALRGGNSVLLVECLNNQGQGHCIVVDRSFVQGGQLHFQVRDPAQPGIELAVLGNDARLAGQHRFWLVSS